jgi:hypothetical protein
MGCDYAAGERLSGIPGGLFAFYANRMLQKHDQPDTIGNAFCISAKLP